jgi:hypothetical protein
MAFTGYSINGIALHDSTRGWRILRAGTQTQGGITKQLTKVSTPGRPGYTPGPSTFTEQAIIFVVQTTRSGLEALLNLADMARTLSLTTPEGVEKEAKVELASAIPGGEYVMDSKFEVTITLIAFEGVWRDKNYDATLDGSVSTPITSAVQVMYPMPGIGAPVYDAQIFIGGIFGQMNLIDIQSGSWLKTTRAWPGNAGNGLLWNGASNQAFISNVASPWVAVADASQYVDTSGNGGFRIEPTPVSGNPAVRLATLQLATLTQTSTTFRIRAKRAYRMS